MAASLISTAQPGSLIEDETVLQIAPQIAVNFPPKAM